MCGRPSPTRPLCPKCTEMGKGCVTMTGIPGRLPGKVALVTGASLGIGRGCALALAEDGADVVVNYLSHEKEAQAAVQEIEALGRRAVAHQADVSDRSQVERMIEATLARYGRLDILVSNAYLSIRQPFLETTPEALMRTLEVSLLGAFHCCQLAARAMVAQGRGGHIIVIGSVHAEHPFGGATAYNMAKWALDGMALTAAAELAPQHIHVNIIHPGWIDTPGERRYLSEEQLIEEGKRIPWGRLGAPREIGRVAAFLASDDAEYMTGAIVRVDGAHILGLT
jgi:glucose 1-dehydrogenase